MEADKEVRVSLLVSWRTIYLAVHLIVAWLVIRIPVAYPRPHFLAVVSMAQAGSDLSGF